MPRYAVRRHRRGAAAVEFAIVGSIVFFLLLAVMIGSLGVFRYHQVASLAREASRWASVRGGQYEQEVGLPAAAPEDVFNKVILPAAITLNPQHLTYSVTWDQSNMPLEVDEDVQQPFGNTVSVTVNYRWFPELLLVGPYNFTSTSTAQMSY